MKMNMMQAYGEVPAPTADGTVAFLLGSTWTAAGTLQLADNVLVTGQYCNGKWWLQGSNGLIEVRPTRWSAVPGVNFVH